MVAIKQPHRWYSSEKIYLTTVESISKMKEIRIETKTFQRTHTTLFGQFYGNRRDAYVGAKSTIIRSTKKSPIFFFFLHFFDFLPFFSLRKLCPFAHNSIYHIMAATISSQLIFLNRPSFFRANTRKLDPNNFVRFFSCVIISLCLSFFLFSLAGFSTHLAQLEKSKLRKSDPI